MILLLLLASTYGQTVFYGSGTIQNQMGISVSAHSSTLTWTASTSPNVTGYNLYRGTAAGGPYTKMNAAPVSALTYTDTAVQAGQSYYYVATAVDSSNNESGYSNEATAQIPSP